MFFLLVTHPKKENHLAVSREVAVFTRHRSGHTMALASWDGEESGEGGLT